MWYVHKTILENEEYYSGVRKLSTGEPQNDQYFGSGKMLNLRIKSGIAVKSKMILHQGLEKMLHMI